MNRMTWRGFTLIELLIVVAIIAILAAIAVPNFLEAQMRAKVTQAKANQRTLAIALESYRADSNGKLPGFSGNYLYANRYPLSPALTSPIAYLTEMDSVDDIFLKLFFYDKYENAELMDWAPAVWDHNIVNALMSGGTAPGMVNVNPVAVTQDMKDLLYNYVEMAFIENDQRGANFMIRGWGPAFASEQLNQTYITAYDPTNGTVSPGHIYRFQ